MGSAQLRTRFPAWNPERFRDGFLELAAGYTESGRVVAALIEWAKSPGVDFRENEKFLSLDESADGVKGIVLEDGERIAGDRVVMAVGAWTPYAAFHKQFFSCQRAAGVSSKPSAPRTFPPECFPVFGADISTTGYYGFPINPDGIMKIANHGPGREMSPDSPQRVVTTEEEKSCAIFSPGRSRAGGCPDCLHPRMFLLRYS